jgi:hypothetical protein
MKKVSLFLAALCVTAPLLAGKANAQAPQLPSIDAGSILNQIQNSQNPFPQPTPSIDTCVFTEFKNNKCYFKCGSGAVLVEPAMRPDFSSGEPAGACASYIIRPVESAFKSERGYSHEATWRKANLRSEDGTEITVSYVPLDLGGETVAAPAWVIVSSPRLRGTEKIRAVIMTYYDLPSVGGSTLTDTQTLDLKYSPYGSFSAQAQKLSMFGVGFSFRQEIAVVVDGRWLVDPVSGSHNFKFKMRW